MSLILDTVSYRYPGQTSGVESVSLDVQKGELCALIGPSGCGKSTLLKLIAGFLNPDSGVIQIAGRAVQGVPPRARNLGVVFQSYALFPHMTAAENIAYPLKLRGIPAAERRARAEAMLHRARLDGFGERLPAQLSGGQQQRVALARALVFSPQALLLDEPLSALDAAHRVALRDEIRGLQQEHGITTIHVTHDQEEALSIADRVAVLHEGRLLQVASPRTLYDHPIDATVAAFVGQANLLPALVRNERCVETALGLLSCHAKGLLPGSNVLAFFRPEQLLTAPAPEFLPEVNRFSGHITADRFLGALRRFDFDSGAGRVLGETASRAAITAIAVPPEAIRLFPALTAR